MFPNGPIAFSGNATDNVGVSSVQVAIRERNSTGTGRWLQANGTWAAGFVWLNGSVLGTPNGTSTSWTYNWTPPTVRPVNTFLIQVRANDAAGNFDQTRPSVNFSVNP